MKKKTYHSAITGKFVTKEFAEENPDITVELRNCNLRQEIIDLLFYIKMNGESFRLKSTGNFADDYLEQK